MPRKAATGVAIFKSLISLNQGRRQSIHGSLALRVDTLPLHHQGSCLYIKGFRPEWYISTIYWGFLIRMVYLYYISCLRYTILVGIPRYHCKDIPFRLETLGFWSGWCISTIYHAWDTPFWSGSLDITVKIYHSGWKRSIRTWRLPTVYNHSIFICSKICFLVTVNRQAHMDHSYSD